MAAREDYQKNKLIQRRIRESVWWPIVAAAAPEDVQIRTMETLVINLKIVYFCLIQNITLDETLEESLTCTWMVMVMGWDT